MAEDRSAEVARCQEAVIGALPQFATSQFKPLYAGWDSLALVSEGWVFKFPYSDKALAKLRREAALLAYLGPRTSMTIPDMVMHEGGGGTPFSQHKMIPGKDIEEDEYHALDTGRREAMALRLARFYAELHGIPLARLHAIGAVPTVPWRRAKSIYKRAASRVPRKVLPFLRRTLAIYRDAEVTGDELVFGYFDGHGWNMAFDHKAGVLNGIYDLADAGFGPRHRDLAYSTFVSADLTLRVIDHYERLTGLDIDRELVMAYFGVLRFSELIGGNLDREIALEAVMDWYHTYVDLHRAGVLNRPGAT